MVRNLRFAKWLALGAAALLFGRQQTRRGVRKLVADLTAPTSGTILVNGKPPGRARQDRDYGMVFQAPVLMD